LLAARPLLQHTNVSLNFFDVLQGKVQELMEDDLPPSI